MVDPLKEVQINNLFARPIVENYINGKIMLTILTPATFYVLHSYGMSLLFGNTANQEFNEDFKKYALNQLNSRDNQEWMQAYPDT